MAKGFNLTAQINLRGPTNLKPIVADIRRQLGSISADVNVKLNPQVAKSISTVTSRLKSMNDILVTARGNADALGSSLSNLSNSLSNISNGGSKAASSISKTGTGAKAAAQNIKQASTAMEEFGKQSYLAIKRFAAFSVVSGTIYKLVNAVNTGFTAFINFDKQLVKLQQVTGKGAIGLKNLENQITNLATSLGVSSESLIEVASTLAQAGLNAEDTRVALSALAKTELAPSFDNLTDTTEGAIAALRQFELQAGDLEAALGSINAVAAAFAVESSDIITAIQRTGGVFAAASKGVSEGKDALNEFIAVFTSVRATTRESAETIATGLRTIFTRIQRGKTIEALKEYGVILTDLEGKFVGPYEAVKRLSEGLKLLDPRDLRFSQIVEELGGFRQIGKVIPLIQQFAVAQKALGIAQTGQTSLTDAQIIAQQSLANQIAKVREQFLALFRDIGQTKTFQVITRGILGLTSAFLSLASAFKPILPVLAVLATIKGVKALGEFGTGFFGGFKKGGGARAAGSNIGGVLTGTSEKETKDITGKASEAIRDNTSAIKSLTTAVNSLATIINTKSTGFNAGGQVKGFATGGYVPGSGNRDTVPAMLTPGEFVIRKKAVETIGADNLAAMNRGGKIQKFVDGGEIEKQILSQTIQTDSEGKNRYRFGLVGLRSGTKEKQSRKESFPINANGFKAIDLYIGTLSEAINKTTSKNIQKNITSSLKSTIVDTAKTLRPLLGGKNITAETKQEILQGSALSSATGSVFESALNLIGSPYLEKTEKTKAIDFPFGLGPIADKFGIPSDVPTDATRTVGGRGKGLSDIKGQIVRFLKAIDRGEFTKAANKLAGKKSMAQINKTDILPNILSNIPAGFNSSESGRNLRQKYGLRQRGALNPKSLPTTLKTLSEQGQEKQFLVDLQSEIGLTPKLEILRQNNGGKTRGFANGGSAEDTVPALLTPGEFVINKKAAKRIGYSRLHQMNKADKIQGYNSGGLVGGIQKFFVGGVAEKDAQRAQGQILSSVEEGAATFAEIMSQLPTKLSDMILSKFKGIEDVEAGQAMSLIGGAPAFSEKTRGMAASSAKASSIGLQITGRKGGATTETVAHETGHLADFELGGGKGDFASEMKGTFQFELIAKIRKHMEDEFKKAGKSSEEINNYLGTGRELFAEFFAKASPEVRAIITSTTDAKSGMKALADSLGETGYTYAGLEASDLMPSKPKTPKKKNEFGFLKQQSKAIEAAKSGAVSFESLKPRTKTRKEAKQQLDDSGLKALTTGISQTSGEIAKLKAQTESLYQQSKNLDNQISQYDQAILKIKSSTEEGAKGNKALNRLIQMKINAETQRLAVDKQAMASEEKIISLNQQKAQQIAAAKAFKTTVGGGGGGPPNEPPDNGPFGLGPEDPGAKQRREQKFADQEFFKYKAAQTGTSEAGVKLDLAQRLGRATYESQELFGGKVSESKTGLVTRRESAMKVGSSIQTAQKAIEQAKKSGDDEALKAATQQLADANSRLAQETEGILQQMIELRPDLASTEEGMKKLTEASNQVAQELSTGNLAAAQEKLGAAVAGTGKGGGLSAEEAATVARTRVAKETGVDSGLLQREFGAGGASAKMAQQQAFIQSREGQRFGKLAEFAPGLTQKFAGTKAGQALGKGADFISGKGGRFSKLFAGAGGFQGIGSGLAVGSEMLKTSGLIDKQTLKNPNVAGAFGAVQGAGVMGATGAELGSQFAGPIGALIGGIGGAVIGGIKGFFDAKNAQILSNALDKLTKSSEGVDIAFKELAKNDTDKNFKNVQKAFGQQIEASKELENIAFGGGEGPSVAGTGGGALAGATGGALIGTAIAGPIGTAIGAALGGLVGGGLAAYMSESQNKANREEALRNRVGSAGAMNESAARMAERQRGRMTNEQLAVSKESGTNLIAQQYKESAIAAAEANDKQGKLTAKQKEKIGQDALETAALDAYMKQRKEAGATDQQITDDIIADRKSALEIGKKALDAQEAAAQKQEELARATKQVAVATESLLDVYRRVGAKAQRFSDEVDDMLGGTQAMIASLGGNAAVQKVDRSGSERVLGNISAYSRQEVEAATQEVVGKLGGGEEAQALGKQAQAAKFLQDRLPGLLKGDNINVNNVMSEIRGELGNMGLTSGPINTMLDEIQKQIEKGQDSGLGTLADEISTGGIDKISATSAEALKQLQNLSKTYNDTLQKSIDLQNQYNESIMQSNTYLRKAGSIRITAELDLAKALGNSPTLAQLNEPIDFEIKDLTKGLVAGGTTDPAAIAAGIVAKTEQNQQLQAANTNLGNVGMQGAAGGIGDAGAKLLSEQQKNIAAMGANNVAINEGRQALEKLANDGTKAANALAKIEEQQRQIEGLGNRFEKIFTAGPEELFKMNRQSAALEAAKVAGPEQFKSRAFRQDAFAGLEQDKEFLTGEEYRKQRGMLMRKSLEAQGYTGQSTINKGGINMTVDEFIKRIEGGISEEDPNVKAYREAVATQIKANEELARLEELKSLQIQEAMLGLQVFLKNEFPKILTDAVKESRADSETKPETKTEASKGEKTKAEAESAKTAAEKKRKELDTQIDKKKLEVSKAEKEVGGWSPGAGAVMNVKIKKRELAELEAQRDAQVKAEEAATAKSKEADVTLAEEKKARDQAKATQAAEEKKAKEAKVTGSMEQSQRARAGVTPTTIPAPPAPGTPEAELANIRQQRAEKEKRNEQTKADEAKQTQTSTQQTQTTTATYGAVKPQVEAVDKFTEGRLNLEKGALTQNVERMTLSKAAKEKELKMKANTLRASKLAAEAAGTTETSPKLAAAQEAYDMAKADMASIDEQMKQAQDRIGAINQTLQGSSTPSTVRQEAFTTRQEQGLQPLSQEQSQQRAELIRKGLESQGYSGETTIQPQGMDSMTIDEFIAKIANGVQTTSQNQPIPSNIPQPVEYNRQVQAAETGTTPNAGTKPTETTGQLITLDPTSLEGLTAFNNTFGSYVERLVNFQFPNIPEKIEMTGTHVVDVRVSGAAAFESLQKGVKDLINKSIDEKMSEIWKQTGGAIGTRPGAPPAKGK